MSAPTRWWWLSFVDRLTDETGATAAMHHGVAVIPADDFDSAVSQAWRSGCNPGGEVVGTELPPWDIPWGYAYRLIDGDEVDSLQAVLCEARDRAEAGVRWHAL